MKKLNEKGLTLVELIVSFALVSVAMLYFYQTVSTVSKLYKRAKIQTNQFTESTYTLRLVKDYCSIEENLNNCIEMNSANSLNKSFLKKIGSNLTVSDVSKDTQTIGSEMYSVLTYKLYIKSGIAVLTTGPNLQSMLSDYTGDITEVVFDKETPEPTDGDWIRKMNISANENGPVWGILKKDSNNPGKYIFHITFNRKKVYANPNSSKLFSFNKNNNSSLKKITGIETLDTSNVTDMSYMFIGNLVLESLDVSHFKTDKVTNMRSMFSNCYNVKSLDVSVFDTSNVTDMNYMFASCSKVESINGLTSFNTEKVGGMVQMFAGCRTITNIDVTKFVTTNVSSISHMFWACTKLTELDVRSFNTEKVTNMTYVFGECKNLKKISGIESWNTSKVTSMGRMFFDTRLTDYDVLDLSGWDTSNVTTMGFMFASCSVRALKLNFNTSNVTNMQHMFYGCSQVEELDLSMFKTNRVTSMIHMFSGCLKLKKLDIRNFDISRITDMRNMFEGDASLNELKINKDKFNIIKGKTVPNETQSYYYQITQGCKKEIQDIINNQIK